MVALAQGTQTPLSLPEREQRKATTSTKQQVTPTPTISLASGAIAGAVEATATYPFEFAKTRAQLRQDASASSKNPFSVIVQTVRNEGPGALYTGCSTLILGTAFKASVRFLSFDTIKSFLSDENGKLSPARGVLAGMAAGAAESVIAVTPTERIKTALIDDARAPVRRYKGGLHALRVMTAERGFGEVYRGLLPTTMKQSATSAVRMGSYNVLKDTMSRKFDVNAKNPFFIFGVGATAGVITVYATQPFDTIKTRAQGARGASTLDAARDILASGGVRRFWDGSTMRLGRLVFSGGIVFTTYEAVSSLLMGLKKAD